MNSGKWDEAQKLLEQIFASQNLYDEERGKMFMTYIVAYLEALVSINLKYKTALEQASYLLKKVGETQRAIADDIELARVEGEIGNLTAKS